MVSNREGYGVIKYALYPGYVTSKYDGDFHYISANMLLTLYGVLPEQCALFDPEYPEKTRGLIELRPQYHGNYTLPT